MLKVESISFCLEESVAVFFKNLYIVHEKDITLLNCRGTILQLEIEGRISYTQFYITCQK
jgi:hypothetical protein